MKNLSQKKWFTPMCFIAFFVILCLITSRHLYSSKVVEIRVTPASVSTTVGTSVELKALGYTRLDKPALRKNQWKLHLTWKFEAEDGSFTVSEDGLLTPIAPGTGTAWAESRDGKLISPAIEVTVN